MKGWRPSACQGSKTGSGPFQAAHSRRIVSTVGLSFPGLGVMATRTTRFAFFARSGSPPLKSDKTTPKSVRNSKKGASPSLAFKRSEEPETKTAATMKELEQQLTLSAPTTPRRRGFEGGVKRGSAQVIDKAQFGRRKFMDLILDTLPADLDFLPPGFGIPFLRIWDSYPELGFPSSSDAARASPRKASKTFWRAPCLWL